MKTQKNNTTERHRSVIDGYCSVPSVHRRTVTLQSSLLCLLVFLLVPLLLFVDAQTNCSNAADTLFSERLTHLRDYAARCNQVDQNECTKRQKLFTIEGGPLGEMGNTMITLVHALWLAGHNNGVLLLPEYLVGPGQTFSSFNLSTFQLCYCIINHSTPNNETALKVIAGKREVIRHPSGFYYGMFEHYGHDKRKPDFLPPYSDAILKEIAHTFLTVYSALWANPICNILDRSTALVLQKLEDPSLSYTAVHKRREGDCSRNMFSVFPTADFNPKQLPMNRPEWVTDEHPLCHMNANFTMAVQQQHNRNETKFFVAFDGKGNVDDYLQIGGIFSTVLGVNETGIGSDTSKAGWRPKRLEDNKFVDMFMSMHADFAILNPQSTYSLMIFVVRVVLGKESVPISHKTDIFANAKDRMSKFRWPAWVSWGMIADQYAYETTQSHSPLNKTALNVRIEAKAAVVAAVDKPVASPTVQTKKDPTEQEIALNMSNDELTTLTKQYTELMAAKTAVDKQHEALAVQSKKDIAEIAALKKQLADLSSANATTGKKIRQLKMQ